MHVLFISGISFINFLALSNAPAPPADTQQVSITIPNRVIEIDSDAFNGCISLTTLVIPDSVVSVADSAFYSLFSLTSVVVSDSVTSGFAGGTLPRCMGYGFRK
jgi:hypothetical protein